MKTVTIVILFIFSLSSLTSAQNNFVVVSGDTIWYGKLTEITPELQAEIDSLPEFILSASSANTTLPYNTDNSDEIWMRDIFNQMYGSCAQASAIGYMFTYELNRLRNFPSNNDTTQYPPGFAYNFLNKGGNIGTGGPYGGLHITRESGCPNVDTYGGMYRSLTHWMSGYDKYLSGLYNRVDTLYTAQYPSHDTVFEKLKHWLYEHNEGEGADTSGGLAVFDISAVSYPMEMDTIDEGEGAGSQILTSWVHPDNDNTEGHTMTVVGYNDSIKYDFNNNGQYDADEYGAIRMANSWGDWGNDGYVYVSYKMFRNSPGVFITQAQSSYQPEIILKVNMQHEHRKRLVLKAGYAESADDNYPTLEKFYKAFTFAGGDYPMQGYGNYDPFEAAFDFSYWFADSTVGKVFFNAKQTDDYGGEVDSLFLIDYRWNEILKVPCEQSEVELDSGNNILSINYDLLPHDKENEDISDDLTLNSNMVSRFKTVVTNNSTLTVDNNVRIDMYDSELKVNSGSEIIIKDSVIFNAKSGNCKLTINGDINDLTGVKFVADTGSSLEIYLDNSNLEVEFSDCDFENISLYGYTDTLIINSKSTFNNSRIRGANQLQIDSVTFTESSISLIAPGLSSSNATITNCVFTLPHPEEHQIISLYRFATYHISKNEFANYHSSYAQGNSSITIEYSGTTAAINNISENIFRSDENGYSNTEGIIIYASISDVLNNDIQDQYVGVMSTGRSQSTLKGTSNFCDEETQVIKNNNITQVYASEYSFPTEFIWNAIYHDTLTKCFVHHDINPNYHHDTVLVDSNYWSRQHDPDSNLIPIGHFDYLPIYNPCSKSTTVLNDVNDLYQSGVDQMANGNYSSAKSTFQELITNYPKTEYANHAMKDILNLELLTDNDYSSLKSYYLSEDSIVGNDRLEKLGQALANKCDEKLGNFEDAIAWYEDMIEDPPTLQDSIFAIIDLENCYLQMGIDTNLKTSSYVGRLPQYKQKTVKAHQDHRDKLLVLLLKRKYNNDSSDEEFINIDSSKPAKLLQNIPNPFSNKTTINFHLNSEVFGSVVIRIYNHVGKQVKLLVADQTTKGQNAVELNMGDLPSGIYYYSLFVNGKQADTKKMVVVK